MKPNTLKFLFAVHNHQPVGNFDHVFEHVFERCYRPYFEVLDPFSRLKTAAHFSGPLLEWIESRHPDYFSHLRGLVAAGRLEMLGGGFYEPLLATLPEADALGQIQMMNDYLAEKFGARPRGLWLAERIWSPALPRLIARAGLEFTVLDDTHFFYAGLGEAAMHGYHITEYQGFGLKIFPILKSLRYSIPFELPEKTLERLRLAQEQFQCQGLTYADDGEKFGSWPDTWQWVYGDGYLEKWFRALEANTDWLETVHFGEFLDAHPPTGRVYLPPASYEEMMEWSLPTESARDFHDLKEQLAGKGFDEARIKRFLRGGQWDNFLAKYQESNQMHKKMLYVSAKVHRLPPGGKETAAARRALYRGQCNCAYWHGLFGGLYLNYLRHAVYRNLIEAETLADRTLHPPGLTMDWVDFDLDGRREVVVSNPVMSAVLAPERGGALVEFDYRPAAFNLSNVLRRREETYHRTIRERAHAVEPEAANPKSIHDRVRFKQTDLEEALVYDRHERFCFQEHFVPDHTTLQQVKQGTVEEQGAFAGAVYTQEDASAAANDLALFRETLAGGSRQPVCLRKRYVFDDRAARLRVDYALNHLGNQRLQGWLGVEFNVTLLAGDAPDRYHINPAGPMADARLLSEGETPGVDGWAMRDDWSGFEIRWRVSTPARALWYPIETVSQSEDGFEKNYQGSCLWFLWEVRLQPGNQVQWSLELEVGPPA